MGWTKSDAAAAAELEAAFDVPFTFSQFCRSGLYPSCWCWRCRRDRGEDVTAETKRIAFDDARAADDVAAHRRSLLSGGHRG